MNIILTEKENISRVRVTLTKDRCELKYPNDINSELFERIKKWFMRLTLIVKTNPPDKSLRGSISMNGPNDKDAFYISLYIQRKHKNHIFVCTLNETDFSQYLDNFKGE